MNRLRHYAATFVAIMLTAGVAIAGGALGTSVGNSTGGGSSSGGIGCATPGGVLYSSTGSCEAAFSYDATTNTLSVDNLNIGSTFSGTDIEMLSGNIDVLGVLQIRGEGPSGTGFSLDGPMNASGYGIDDLASIGNTLGDINVNAALQFGGYSIYGVGNIAADYIYGQGGTLSVTSTVDMTGQALDNVGYFNTNVGAGVELTDNVNSYDHNRLYICTDTSNLTIWPGNDVDIQNGGALNISSSGGVNFNNTGDMNFNGTGDTYFNINPIFFNGANFSSAGDVSIQSGVSLTAMGSSSLRSVIEFITPGVSASFSTSKNNYAIAGPWVRLSATAASLSITGIVGLADGYVLRLSNVGSNTITISNQSASSTAANRIITGTGADYSFLVDQTIDLIYDATTTRWRKVL